MQSLTILHSLPGRLRLALDPPVLNFDDVRDAVKAHPGIYLLSYNTTTKSILAQFDPDAIENSELVMRLALAVSVWRDLQPIIIRTRPQNESVDHYGLLSGGVVAAAAIASLAAKTSRVSGILATAAGISTTVAILNHAFREYRQRGDFHPETLSVIYLGSSFLRGNPLPASVVAWLATFARHLTGTAPEQYVLQAVEGEEEGRYEVQIRSFSDSSTVDSLFQFTTKLLADALTGSPQSPDSFMSQMKQVSRAHAAGLEGLDGVHQRIQLTIQ